MIKTHNRQINTSYDVESLYRAYTDYRHLVTNHIKKLVKKGQAVLIIGAGNLNDLNIEVLEETNVTLVDIDETAVKTGLLRQGQSVKDYTITIGDLTGLESTNFFSDLKSCAIEKYYECEIKLDLECYDVIVVLPIYTQLLLPQLMSLLDYKTLESFLPLIQNRIDTLNDFLRQHLKQTGQMILFSDVVEYHSTQEEYHYLSTHASHVMILEDFYESYLNTYGYGLGSYGLYEMSQHLTVVKKDYLIWPIASDRLMLIEMDVVKTSD